MTSALVFVIEDDPKLGMIYDTVLRQMGHQTEIIRYGDQALARLKTTVPVLVLLDLHIPYVSGVTILQTIRADERLAQLPVLVITADLYTAKTIENQASHILIKPFGVGELREAVKRLLPNAPTSAPAAD